MARAVIACRTIEHELRAAMCACRCCDEVIWLESGLHDVPAKLHGVLQDALDGCTGFDTVLLAMGFCGNSVLGLRSGGFQLVLPRADDCITLLLGSTARRVELLSERAYFMTEGWLRGERNLWREYEHVVERYGKNRGKAVFDTMLRNYRKLVLVDTGCFDTEEARAQTQEIARKLNLAYDEIPGTLQYLRRLLDGPWEKESFIVLPPYAELTQES